MPQETSPLGTEGLLNLDLQGNAQQIAMQMCRQGIEPLASMIGTNGGAHEELAFFVTLMTELSLHMCQRPGLGFQAVGAALEQTAHRVVELRTALAMQAAGVGPAPLQ